jgi:menaquinone-dependent protoporphyrinogen IX oxidase
MKTLILYTSHCGHTKRYANSLKVRVLADEILEMKHVSYKQIKDYDTIVYMGPIKNNVIERLNKLMKHYEKIKDKNIIIAGCGISCIRPDDYQKGLIITSNDLDDKHVRLYLLPGGLDLSLMNPIKRAIFKQVIQYQIKKNDTPGASIGLENMLRNGVDYVNPDNLDRMVKVITKLGEMHDNANK